MRAEQFCYVTTTGRRSGRPHEIEIWFVVHEDALFLMAGGGESADWVKNMRAHPAVTVRLGGTTFEGVATVGPTDVDEITVRRAMAQTYQGWEPGRELSGWATSALVVRIDPLGPEAA